jgi:hypothetical protein
VDLLPTAHKGIRREREKPAFEIAQTGTEQGIYGVLKTIVRRTIDDYAVKEIAARISNFWNSLSTDEKLALSQEYLDKYGHLLPLRTYQRKHGKTPCQFPQSPRRTPQYDEEAENIGRG